MFVERLHPRDHDGKFARGADVARHAAVRSNTERPVKVLTRGQVWPFGSDWQASDDLDERAGGLWSESYHGLRNVRQAMRNLWAGRAWDDGVDRRGFGLTLLRVEDEHGRPGRVYDRADLDADILNAAVRLQQRLAAARTHRTPLYRGMRLSREQLWSEGDTIDVDVASWTTQRDWAAVYAMTDDHASKGAGGDHAVIVRMVGQKRSADIDDIVGRSQRGSGEHLAGGRYRVRRVTRRGRTVNVEVEQVYADVRTADGRTSAPV